jgi:hypothetical protein
MARIGGRPGSPRAEVGMSKARNNQGAATRNAAIARGAKLREEAVARGARLREEAVAHADRLRHDATDEPEEGDEAPPARGAG